MPGFDNSRIAIDLTTRASYWEEADELTLQEFIGIDYYQILSLDGKDFAISTINHLYIELITDIEPLDFMTIIMIGNFCLEL